MCSNINPKFNTGKGLEKLDLKFPAGGPISSSCVANVARIVVACLEKPYSSATFHNTGGTATTRCQTAHVP